MERVFLLTQNFLTHLYIYLNFESDTMSIRATKIRGKTIGLSNLPGKKRNSLMRILSTYVAAGIAAICSSLCLGPQTICLELIEHTKLRYIYQNINEQIGGNIRGYLITNKNMHYKFILYNIIFNVECLHEKVRNLKKITTLRISIRRFYYA